MKGQEIVLKNHITEKSLNINIFLVDFFYSLNFF